MTIVEKYFAIKFTSTNDSKQDKDNDYDKKFSLDNILSFFETNDER